MGHGTPQILIIKPLHIRVLVGVPVFCAGIQIIESLSPLECQLSAVVDRLPAAARAAARTFHDFNKIIMTFAPLDLLKEPSGVAEAADYGGAQRDVADGKFRFLKSAPGPEPLAADRLKRLRRRIFSSMLLFSCILSFPS